MRLSTMAVYKVPILLNWTSSTGGPGVNVWHARTTGDFTTSSADLQSLLDDLHDFYTAVLAGPAAGGGGLAGGYTISLGDVTDQETSEYGGTYSFANITGGATGSAPPVLAAVVGWRTSLSARRGRGRTFLGPLSPTALESNGTIATSHKAHWETAAQALVDASSGFANGSWGVWGLVNPAPEGTEPEDIPDLPHVLRDFTGFRVRDIFASLRSRRD